MRTIWLRIRAVGETLLVGLAWIVVPLLPRAAVVGLANVLGNLGFYVARRERRVALANLDLAFDSEMTGKEKARLARRAFRTFALVLLDLFWFAWRRQQRVGAHVTFDPSFEHYFGTVPVIAVTAHLGNWEIMGLAVAQHGEPTISVAATLDNRFLNRMLNRLRGSTGQEIARQAGAVRVLLKALKEGRGRVALLMDQNTLPQDGGLFVALFGRSVPISKAAAGLALHGGAPLVFVYCVPDEKGEYRAYALPPLPVRGKGLSEIEVTQAITGMLESVVRKHPGQWLWMYKRWKYIPDNEAPERYPFYARRLPAANKGKTE